MGENVQPSPAASSACHGSCRSAQQNHRLIASKSCKYETPRPATSDSSLRPAAGTGWFCLPLGQPVHHFGIVPGQKLASQLFQRRVFAPRIEPPQQAREMPGHEIADQRSLGGRFQDRPAPNGQRIGQTHFVEIRRPAQLRVDARPGVPIQPAVVVAVNRRAQIPLDIRRPHCCPQSLQSPNVG